MYNKSNLSKLEKIDGLAPEVMKAFWAMDKAALAVAAIPVKYKENDCRRRGSDDAMLVLHRYPCRECAEGRRR
jgi:hypothetical protein